MPRCSAFTSLARRLLLAVGASVEVVPPKRAEVEGVRVPSLPAEGLGWRFEADAEGESVGETVTEKATDFPAAVGETDREPPKLACDEARPLAPRPNPSPVLAGMEVRAPAVAIDPIILPPVGVTAAEKEIPRCTTRLVRAPISPPADEAAEGFITPAARFKTASAATCGGLKILSKAEGNCTREAHSVGSDSASQTRDRTAGAVRHAGEVAEVKAGAAADVDDELKADRAAAEAFADDDAAAEPLKRTFVGT